MQITLVMSAMILISSVLVGQKNGAPPKSTKTPVEVWCGGDDGLTQGVCAALETALASSPDFVSSSEKTAGTLVVTIPTNVNWKEIGKRTRVFYTVEFTSANDKKLRTRKGSCWNDDFATCANQVVEQAKIAARKVHPQR